jgi:two-component system LytT family response regulator
MRKIRTLIVDDEPLAREGIAVMLQGDAEIEIVGQCGDGQDAIDQVMAQRPDLAFLDIHMPRLNGLEVLERLPPDCRPVIIFVTAHDQYAIRAFELCATEYLLKPFHDDRFKSAVRRAKEQISHGDAGRLQRQMEALVDLLRPAPQAASDGPAESAEPRRRRIAFKVSGTYEVMDADDIGWLEAQGNLVKLGVGNRTPLIRDTLEQVLQRLDPGQFIRVHRSYAVNAHQVKKILPMLYGDHTIVMSDGAKIRLSRSYRHQLKALLPSISG